MNTLKKKLGRSIITFLYHEKSSGFYSGAVEAILQKVIVHLEMCYGSVNGNLILAPLFPLLDLFMRHAFNSCVGKTRKKIDEDTTSDIVDLKDPFSDKLSNLTMKDHTKRLIICIVDFLNSEITDNETSPGQDAKNSNAMTIAMENLKIAYDVDISKDDYKAESLLDIFMENVNNNEDENLLNEDNSSMETENLFD